MPLPADGSQLKLGKGSLLLDQLLDGVSQGFDFAGNVSALTLTADVQTVQKFSSTQQAAPLIGRAVTQIAYTLAATLDEFGLQMLKKFLLAEENDKVQNVNASVLINIGPIVAGRYYQVGDRQITSVVVSEASTPLVLGTDYELNAEFGLVRPLVGGALADGDTMEVVYSRPQLTIAQLRIAQIASPTVHVLYVADDANADAAGAKDRLEVWKANLAPDGELNLIGDDYGSYQLSMAVIDDSVNHPDDPFGIYERI